jgi:hypothetical protein
MGRLILDFFIFFARHMVLAFLAFLALWLLLDRWGPVRGKLTGFSPVVRRRVAVWSSLAVLTVFVVIGVWYLNLDGFAGEVEPLVTSLSWLVQHGQPLYHEFEAPQRYSVLYGPSAFLVNGLFLQILGPSLFSAKLASFLGVMGCLVFLYCSLARSRRNWVALLITGLAVLYFWSQGFAVYLVRPDALLLFALGLALYAAGKGKPLVALVTVAVMMGFAINLKVHAVVYFIPVLAIMGGRFGWLRTLAAAAGSSLVVVAPFAFHPQISAVNYIEWLRNALNHGLVSETVPATVQFTAYLLLPIAALLFVSPLRSQHLKRHGVTLVSLAPAFALTLVLAAKPGAGLVHLLPLVPTTLYLVGLILHEMLDLNPWLPAGPGRVSRQGILAAVCLTVLLAGSVNIYRAVRLVDWQVDQAPDLVADVQGIMASYPDISIGMACGGEEKSFRNTWLRPLLVFANNPLLVEPIAVMECHLTGHEMPLETYKALEKGVVTMWLVPRNQRPFDKLNWYAPHEPIFSPRFIEHFESLYSLHGHSQYFDLWFWNGCVMDGSEAPVFTGSELGKRELMAP